MNERINRLALEDRDAKYMTDEVAPLVAKLVEGKNYVNARQFSDLVLWFQDELEDPGETMEAGRFQLYEHVEVIRVKPVTRMTVSELARKTGVPRMTLHDLLTKTGLEPETVGCKKYYNLNELAPFLRELTSRREE